MAPAQLARLRPQITALSALFEQPDAYTTALTALMEQYRSEIDFSASRITPNSLVKRLNIPEIITAQLGISYNHLCQVYPDQAVEIAEKVWNKEYFEYKEISILLLSKLDNNNQEHFFNFVNKNIHAETVTPIFAVLLENINANPSLRNDPRWQNIFEAWILSEELHLQKFGLKAITSLIAVNKQFPHPNMLNKIKPLLANPTLPFYSELLQLIEQLSITSLNETTALLISLGIQNPNPNMNKFIRKCLQFFPLSLSVKIKDSIQI